MTLDWIYLRDGEMTTRNGEYTVTNATVWKDSRVIQQRYEAWRNGGSIGRYPTKRLALDACEYIARIISGTR